MAVSEPVMTTTVTTAPPIKKSKSKPSMIKYHTTSHTKHPSESTTKSKSSNNDANTTITLTSKDIKYGYGNKYKSKLLKYGHRPSNNKPKIMVKLHRNVSQASTKCSTMKVSESGKSHSRLSKSVLSEVRTVDEQHSSDHNSDGDKEEVKFTADDIFSDYLLKFFKTLPQPSE